MKVTFTSDERERMALVRAEFDPEQHPVIGPEVRAGAEGFAPQVFEVMRRQIRLSVEVYAIVAGIADHVEQERLGWMKQAILEYGEFPSEIISETEIRGESKLETFRRMHYGADNDGPNPALDALSYLTYAAEARARGDDKSADEWYQKSLNPNAGDPGPDDGERMRLAS